MTDTDGTHDRDRDAERSFELTVINRLLDEGDSGVAQYAIEHALDRHALGPVEIANYARIQPDADDSEAVGLVVDYLQQGYRDDVENGYEVPAGARGSSISDSEKNR